MGLSVYLWLYYSAFSLAWFLLGLLVKPYVSIITKLLAAGITGLRIRAGMGRGTATMGGYNSPLERGVEWVEWDFPLVPVNVNRYTEPISFGNAISHGGNGLPQVGSVG